jgi:hypothetical protein
MPYGMKHIVSLVVALGAIAGAQSSDLPPYSGSYALVVGVSKYESPAWPALPRVLAEVHDLSAALKAQGFKVTELAGQVDSRLLRDNIEKFIADYGYQPKARIVMSFSAHGFTRRDGRTGYIVPSDAPSPSDEEQAFLGKAIPMSQFNAWARQMEALHVLFVFDSCFSGSIFQSRSIAIDSRPLMRNLSQPVREFLTAGSANETVPAASVFTPTLIRALEGEADLNRDGLVTGTEIGQWILDRRGVFAAETPQFGKILDPDLDRGDIVFASPATAATAAGSTPPAPPAAAADRSDPRAGFYGSYAARGWVETDGSTYDWELRPGKGGLLVRAWRPTDRENRSPQAEEIFCNWIGGEADEFQCYLLPGRPHVTPRRPEDDREMNTTTFQLVLHPEGLLVRELAGPRSTVTLFRRAGGVDLP